MSDNEKLVAQQATAKESIEVVYRTGEAINPKDPKTISFEGVLSSPFDYLRQRPGEGSVGGTYATVNKEKGLIVLHLNERDHFRNEITGRLKVSEKFTELGINAEKPKTPEGMAKMLKLKRAYFKSIEDHARIISILRNVKAKINQEVEAARDNGGNRTDLFKQTVESNIPKEFTLRVPLIQGGEPFEFPVEVILEAGDGEIYCYLESVDAAEEMDRVFEKMVNEQVQELQKVTTVLFH